MEHDATRKYWVEKPHGVFADTMVDILAEVLEEDILTDETCRRQEIQEPRISCADGAERVLYECSIEQLKELRTRQREYELPEYRVFISAGDEKPYFWEKKRKPNTNESALLPHIF